MVGLDEAEEIDGPGDEAQDAEQGEGLQLDEGFAEDSRSDNEADLAKVEEIAMAESGVGVKKVKKSRAAPRWRVGAGAPSSPRIFPKPKSALIEHCFCSLI